MLYEGIDWNLFGSPGFREKPVRKELVVELLRALGCSAFGPLRGARLQ